MNRKVIDTKNIELVLLQRHLMQTKIAISSNKPDSEVLVLQLRQRLEVMLMYFYKKVKLSFENYTTFELNNETVQCAVKGIEPLDKIVLNHKVTGERWFEISVYAPKPLVLIPDGDISKVFGLIRGAYEGITGKQKILVMEYQEAVKYGLDVFASDFALDDNYALFYIGFVYKLR